MYESFFGMSRRPFSATPVVECVLETDSFRDAKAALISSFEQGNEISVLTGPSGSGKTLLCKVLQAELDDEYEVAFLLNAHFSSRRSLLQAVLYELGQPYLRMGEQELRLELIQAAKARCEDKKRILLIVDEAHLLSIRLLEELRSVTNLASLETPLFQLLLSGNVELEETLANRELEAFNQRIGEQTMLEPFTREESVRYMEYRFEEVGVSLEDVFTPEAVNFICQASDGYPRCLNQLCDHSLLLGYLGDQQPIELSVVQEALDDLKQLPLHWNEPVIGINPSQPAPEVEESTEDAPALEMTPTEVEVTDHRPEQASVFEVGASWETPPPEVEPDLIEEHTSSAGEEEAVPDIEPDHLHETPTPAVPEIASFETPPVETVSSDARTLEEQVEESEALYERIADYTSVPETEKTTAKSESDALSSTSFSASTDADVEYLWDRYALLDSGRDLPGEFPEESDNDTTSVVETPAETELEDIGPADVEQNEEGRSEFIPGTPLGSPLSADAESTIEETWQSDGARSPEQLIDELLPLVNSALEEDVPVDTAETAPESLELEAEAARIPSAPADEDSASQEDSSDIEQQETDWVSPPITASDLQSDEDSPSLMESFLQAQAEEESVESPVEESEISSDSSSGVRFGRLFTKLRKRNQNH